MKDNDQKQCSNTNLCAAMAFMVLFVVTAVASLGAQTATTGDIAGVITDPTAAVLSGVAVTLTNLDTGSSTSTTTNSQGSYNFAFL
jgi:Carboxypeptidase regulatory-like domain